MNCSADSMPSDIREMDVQGVLHRHNVRYEVRPYYVVLEQRPAGATPVEKKIRAAFDLDLYGALDKIQLPLFEGDEGREVVAYFETMAKEIQSRADNDHTKVEVMPYADSLVLDTHQHFRPEVVLRIRITHARGLDQPAGPSEEQVLSDIRERLHQLEVKQV
jgi:hypothetical protein